jgi:hypothetical protein
MRVLTKMLSALALCASALTAQAQVFGNTNTYSGLAWDFFSSQSGFTSCTTLFLDATGDFTNSSNYTMYGDLSCTGGSYLVSGSAYFDGGGGFNMQLELGISHKLLCISLPGATGTCTIYNNSGTQTGTAFVEFL